MAADCSLHVHVTKKPSVCIQKKWLPCLDSLWTSEEFDTSEGSQRRANVLDRCLFAIILGT